MVTVGMMVAVVLMLTLLMMLSFAVMAKVSKIEISGHVSTKSIEKNEQ
jgi:cell division septal protein FtsQ